MRILKVNGVIFKLFLGPNELIYKDGNNNKKDIRDPMMKKESSTLVFL